MSALRFFTAKPAALSEGTEAVKLSEGFEFFPEILRVPVSFPVMSIPEDFAREASASSLKSKLKSSGDFPETEAAPFPVIAPSPLRAVKLLKATESPFLLMSALRPVKARPLAVTDFAETLTLIFSSFVKSPSRAVVSSRSLALIIFIASRLGEVARSLTAGLSAVP